MSCTGSINALLQLLKDGDHKAARQLWQRYYPLNDYKMATSHGPKYPPWWQAAFFSERHLFL